MQLAQEQGPLAGGMAVSWPLQQETASTDMVIWDAAGRKGCLGVGCTGQLPSPFPPQYGAQGWILPPPAPTLLLQQHRVWGAVGTQGGLLHWRHPLLRGRVEAVVLAEVWIRLEQDVLLQGIPCRKITSGKRPGSPTHRVTHPAPCKWG